jgi:hypothetical protein
MQQNDYNNCVFINCPFDSDYIPIFHAIVFSVIDCGYVARCARGIDDSSEVRIEKITKIISECKYGIHDISRTELSKDTNLPRFNMSFEFGIFWGAKRFGNSHQKKKKCLVLDSAPYRYQSFISDISGQDIRSHNNDDSEAIKLVSNWLRTMSERLTIPGGSEILRRYRLFTSDLPNLCKKLKLTVDEMSFSDFTSIVYVWLDQNP